MKKIQKWQAAAASTAAIACLVMSVVICLKSVSVLFKMDRALTLYLRRNSPKKHPPIAREDEDDIAF